MSAEAGFLTALAAFIAAQPALAGARVGSAQPIAATDLPAVVLSLDEVHRLGAGLGERAAMITDGALPVAARIDLANPVLPGDPGFRLLSGDRRTLVLPHGGWVKADGTGGLLSSADLQVSVAGAARTVVNAVPAAAEVRPDAGTGTLLFGAALPATGIVQASYVLGQWERRVTPIAGTLEVDVRAADAADVQALSDALLDALLDAMPDPGAPGSPLPRGLHKVTLRQMSSVGPRSTELADSRGRSLRFTFEYDHQIDRPDSSGGIIRRIPITTRLQATSIEPASGALVTTVTSEVDP